MKTFAKFMLLGALIAAPFTSFADDQKTDEQLSREYKHRIEALKGQIKTNKANQKLNPTDAKLKAEEAELKISLEDIQAKKKVIDGNLKAQKALEKANKKAKKAALSSLQTEVNGKVSKESGKGLSTNDYSDAEKAKVSNAASEVSRIGGYFTMV